jgi:predicted acetyltransferase
VTDDYRSIPIDAESSERLAARGLRLGLLDTADREAFDRWLQVDARGFHQGRMSDEEAGWWRDGVGDRRTTGVWDDGPDPVATTSSWPVPMTVPGGTAIPSWAISSVTVAPTHRRRGVARALLEAELRTAVALGLPMAILTVSESTLYGRYGFAPAAFASDYVFDTWRATWTGPEPAGRLTFVPIERWRELIAPLHERARLHSPGEIEVWGLRWDQISGAKADDKDRAKRMRAVKYEDEAGEVRGLALYRVGGGDEDFTKHHITVDYLCTETPEAYAALWRFLLELDLVTEVRANLRAVDEPVRWMVQDQRGIRQSIADHQWVRILDVKAALEARAYERDGVLEFRVVDAFGWTEGGWRLEVVDGRGTVTAGDGGLELTVGELSAAYLGAVPPVTPELGLFRTARAPWLSIWY